MKFETIISFLNLFCNILTRISRNHKDLTQSRKARKQKQ